MREKSKRKRAEDLQQAKQAYRGKLAKDLKAFGKMTLPASMESPVSLLPAPQPVAAFLGPDAGLTPDQKALQDCCRYLSGLIVRKPQAQKLMAAMAGLRQGYVVAYTELQRLIEQDSRRDDAGLLMDFTSQLVSDEAAKPFDENVLVAGLLREVYPTLLDVVEEHLNADAAEEAKIEAEADQARRARPISLGLPFSVTREDTGLPRDRSLVLVGWRPVVQWVLGQIWTHVTGDASVAAVRLGLRVDKSATQAHNAVQLPVSTWRDAANTQTSFVGFLGSYLQPLMLVPDLLVCDDLAEMHSLGLVNRPRGARAGDAQKRLRRWADGIGTAIVAGVPLDDPSLGELETSAYDQLKTFTFLRTVRHTTGGEVPALHYRISVGDHAAVFDVPQDEIHAYTDAKLILPTGVMT